MLNSPDKQRNPQLVALGDAIRRIRREKGISQEKLALLANVDRSYMGHIERGNNNVALLMMLRIVQALDISVEDLMAEAGL